MRQVLPVLVTSRLYLIVSPAFKTPSSPGSASAVVAKASFEVGQAHHRITQWLIDFTAVVTRIRSIVGVSLNARQV